VLDLGLVSLQELIEAAIAVSGKDFVFPVEFFDRVPDREFSRANEELWLRLWTAYVQPSRGWAYRFIGPAVKKSRLFWEPAIAFLSMREASGRLEEWSSAFAATCHAVDGDVRERVNAILYELITCELTFGHITKPSGLKIIQSTHGQTVDRSVQKCFDHEFASPPRPFTAQESSSPEKGGSHSSSQVQLRGWRELAILLHVAPPTSQTLDLMMKVLEVHERPFTQVFVNVLKNFDRPSIIQWIDKLLTGRQARQIIAMDILWMLARSYPNMWEYLAAVLHRFTTTRDVPDLVNSKALRILREIFDSSLSSDIIGLFTCPELRNLRSQAQREAWRVTIRSSLSLFEPSMRADSRLPLLGGSSPSPIVSSTTGLRKPKMSSPIAGKLLSRSAFLHFSPS
jgi:hypothetical protein